MPIHMGEIEFVAASDNSLLVRMTPLAGRDISEEVLSLFWRLYAEQRERWILNLHPGHSTVLIRFDPMKATPSQIEAFVKNQLQMDSPDLHTGKQVIVPVCYGGRFGPDLDEVSQLCQLTPAQVVDIHSSARYRVNFLGFTPGFPYLGGMDPKIAVPRLPSPRKNVAAGSVAIADGHSGIYPVDSPGGWRVIGRTPAKLFTPENANPTLLLPGDTVRFRPITPAECEKATHG